MQELRTLVVYYTRSGHTRTAAQAIARALDGADVEEIRDDADRSGWRGYLRSGREAIRRERATLAWPGRDVSAYDLVVVGTPVWFSSLSSPVRAWLHDHRSELQHAAFFLTHGGTGAERVFSQMRSVARIDPTAVLAIHERAMGARAFDLEVGAFTAQCESQLKPLLAL